MKLNKTSIIIIVLVFLTGCSEKTFAPNSISNNASKGALKISDGRTKNYKNEVDIDLPAKEFEALNIQTDTRAEVLASLVKSIQGIEDSTVVITGSTAIVGIDLVSEVKDQSIIEIKKEVEKIVRLTDTEINHVAVTASPELFERIIDISSKNDSEKNPLKKYKDNDVLFRSTPTI